LFLTVAFAVLLLLTQAPLLLAVECAAVVLLVVRLGLVRAWAGMLRALIPMGLFFLIVMVYSFDPAAAIGGVLRLAGMTTAFFVFFRTTAPEDLANALVKACAPYVFAFILTTALQYVPVLARKMQDVMDAQRARGVRLERDWASLGNYPALFAPFLIQSFTLADQLAEAMEARGFGAPRRTFAREFSFTAYDYALVLLGVLMLIAGWWLV
jgi:energy-coupling factor transport system permease protein